MRHQKSGRKLNRTSSHRDAMFRNMTTSLLIHDRIRTTDAKAKELRRYVERMITLARKARKVTGEGDTTLPAKALHYRRQALKYLSLPGIDASKPDERAERKELLDKLFVDLAERFAERPGGYTRVLKMGTRRGDGAPLSMIEFVAESLEAESKPTKKKSRKKKKPAAKAAAPAAATQAAEEAPADKAAAQEAPVEEVPAEKAAAEQAQAVEESEPAPEPKAGAKAETLDEGAEKPEPAADDKEKPEE